MKKEGQGWILFSMIVLFVAGVMRIFDGIWMIHNGNAAQSLSGAIFGSSLKTYGWIYIIVGVLLILVSLSLMSGSELGRWLGVAAGAILAISAVWVIPYFQVWGLLYAALGIGIIYGLVAHGGHDEATEVA
jgi:hypothetical protein